MIGDAGNMLTDIYGKTDNDPGYIICSRYWKRGYGTEAAGACKKYAFEIPGIKRLCVSMPANHIASIRVAEKIEMAKVKEFII